MGSTSEPNLERLDGDRVLIYRKDADPPVLPLIWEKGGRLIGGFQWRFPVRSWLDVYGLIEDLPDRRIDEVQIWSHASPGNIHLEGDLDEWRLRTAFGDRVDGNSLLWPRSCNLGATTRGKRAIEQLVRVLGFPVCAHTFTVNLERLSIGGLFSGRVPSPYASGGHILLPDCPAYWSSTEGVGPDGRLLVSGRNKPNTCTILTMTPPEAWWEEAARARTLHRRGLRPPEGVNW